jgi:hypothetical protein
VRGQGGRAAAVGECGFNGFRYDVKKEGEGELVGRCLMRGNKGGADGALLPLPWSTGGRPMAAHGVATPARPTAAQVTDVGDEQWSGPSGLLRPVGQLGRSGPCRLGGARWAGTE